MSNEEFSKEMGDENKPAVNQNESTVELKNKPKSPQRKPVAPPSEIETRRISVAQFFDQNKSIAGFGNPMRATFTSIRELVENGLDAAEKLGIPPRIEVDIEKLLPKEIQKLFNLKTPLKEEKNLDFLRISVKDNGIGVKGSSIPWLFGRVLTGTKYGAQQTRGTFGLGAKMCLLYAMSTVDVPVTVKSRHKDSSETHEYQLFIDLEKNEPIIHSHKVYQEGEEGAFDAPGTEVSITIMGAWSRARSYVLEYFKQLAIITPYADFFIRIPGDKIGIKEEIQYLRVIDDMPPPPKTVPIHPWGCDITQFKTEIKAAKEDNLIDFLVNHFMGVSRQAAESFFEVLGIDASKSPHELTQEEIRRIVHEGFKRSYEEAKTVKRKRDRIFKFDEPSGDALSPLGAHRLRKGLEKELQPAFVEAITRPPKAYSGHPFIIEAALGYGGGVSASATRMSTHDNKIVYRFANRIPLIFGAGSDVVTSVVSEIKWNEYGLTKSSDPLAIAVSLVSTKIPFPETSKEYIDHVDEIAEEIRLALMQLGRKLRTYLRRTRTRQRERQRVSRFERYAPETISNLVEILKKDGRWEEYLEHEKARITAALASGETRVIRMEYPPGESLPKADVWLSGKDEEKLRKNNIHTVEEFLLTPNKELAKILGKDEERIDLIKRRTIYELDLDGRAPPLIKEKILKEEIDKRFVGGETKEGNKFLSLHETLLRRWIKTGHDYLVSPIPQLARILYLEEKLFEQKKEELRQLANSIQENVIPDDNIVAELEAALEQQETVTPDGEQREDAVSEALKPNEIDFSLLLPSFEELLEQNLKVFSKRGIKTHYDFIVEVRIPNKPLSASDISDYLIEHVINYFEARAKIDPKFLKQNITKLSPDWTDGYTKTAFKRRKIITVEDFLKTSKDILFEIGELRRNLFEKFVKRVLEDHKTPLDHMPTQIPELYEKYEPVKILKAAKIRTVEQFLDLSSPKIKNNRKLRKFLDFLLEESKLRLLNYYFENQLTLPISAIKDFPREYERYLLAKGIRKKMDYILASLKELVKKDFDRERVLEIKERLGSSIKRWFPDNYEVLKEHGIVTLEQLVYTPKKQLDRVKDPNARQLIQNITQILELPVTLISRDLIPHADVLYEAGIVSVGKFLTWSLEDISMLTGQSREQIRELIEKTDIEALKNKASEQKGSISILEKLGFPDVSKISKKYGIESLEEFYFLDLFGSRLYKGKKQRLIEKISNVYIEPVNEFVERILPKTRQGKKKLLTQLKKENIQFTYQLFQLTPQQISKYGSGNKNLLQELLRQLESSEEEYSDEKTAYRVYKAHFLLHKSISELSDLSPNALRKLKQHSYTRVGQFFMHSPEEMAKILGEPVTRIKAVFNNPSIGRTPVPLFIEEGKNLLPTIKFKFEDEEHFTSKELLAFKNHGYHYIDQVYFKTHPYTFEVVGVSWDTVKRFNKLLGSPLVLMSWEQKQVIESPVQTATKTPSNPQTTEQKEQQSSPENPVKEDNSPTEKKEIVFYESLTAKQMDFLAKKGIVNVIDFLLAPNDKLAEYLGWDLEKVSKRKRSIILEETGIELAELDLLRPSQLKALEERGIITLEDLYFSTYEETWDEPELPWESLSTIKKLLRLPIQAIKDDIDEEVLHALQSINVPNILSFILTANEVLEFKTGMPAERFENTKAGINFADLQDTYDKPVYFTPGLSYYETQLLYEKGYERIVDLLLESPSKIAKILNKKPSEVKTILSQIDKASIQKTEDERGIAIKEIGVFSSQEERAITHSSVFEYNKIDTLQELYYQIREGTFYGSPELLEKIKWVNKSLDIPVQFLIKSKEILELLSKRNILLLRDLLFYFTTEEEYSAGAEEIINSLYRELIDLSRVVALAMIPLKSLLVNDEDGLSAEDKEQSILDFLVKNHLNGKTALPGNVTLLDLVRFFSSPVRITPLSRHVQPGEEHLLDARVADIVLEKYEETDSTYLISQYLKVSGGLRQVLKRLKLPLSVLPLDQRTMFRLISKGISTVQEFMSQEIKLLASYSGLTQKEIRQIISQFTYDKGIETLKTRGIPIEFTTYFDEPTIKDLKDHGIEYFDQIICYSQLELAELPTKLQEKVSQVKEALLGSIEFLPTITPIEKHKLRAKGITSPYGVLVSYQLEGKPITEMIQKVNIKEILESREEKGTSLSWLDIEDQDSLLQLSQLQVKNVQDFYDRFISEEFPLELVPSKLRSSIIHGQKLDLSIGLLPLDIKEKIEFYHQNRLLLIDVLPEMARTPGFNKLKFLEEQIEERKTPLAALTPINKVLVSRFEKTGLSSIQEIIPYAKVPSCMAKISSSVLRDLENLLSISTYSISLFNENIISRLRENKISSLGELFVLDAIQLKELLGEQIYSDFASGKYKYRKSAELPEEIRTRIGVSSIHDLITEFIAQKYEGPHREILSYPLSLVNPIPPNIKAELRRKRIKTIGEFISQNTKELASELKISRKALEELKIKSLAREKDASLISIFSPLQESEVIDILKTDALSEKGPFPVLPKEFKLQVFSILPVFNINFNNWEEYEALFEQGVKTLLDGLLMSHWGELGEKQSSMILNAWDNLINRNVEELTPVFPEKMILEIINNLVEKTPLHASYNIPIAFLAKESSVVNELEERKIFSAWQFIVLPYVEQNLLREEILTDIQQIHSRHETLPFNVELENLSNKARNLLSKYGITKAIYIPPTILNTLSPSDVSKLHDSLVVLNASTLYLSNYGESERKAVGQLWNNNTKTIRQLLLEYVKTGRDITETLVKRLKNAQIIKELQSSGVPIANIPGITASLRRSLEKTGIRTLEDYLSIEEFVKNQLEEETLKILNNFLKLSITDIPQYWQVYDKELAANQNIESLVLYCWLNIDAEKRDLYLTPLRKEFTIEDDIKIEEIQDLRSIEGIDELINTYGVSSANKLAAALSSETYGLEKIELFIPYLISRIEYLPGLDKTVTNKAISNGVTTRYQVLTTPSHELAETMGQSLVKIKKWRQDVLLSKRKTPIYKIEDINVFEPLQDELKKQNITYLDDLVLIGKELAEKIFSTEALYSLYSKVLESLQANTWELDFVFEAMDRLEDIVVSLKPTVLDQLKEDVLKGSATPLFADALKRPFLIRSFTDSEMKEIYVNLVTDYFYQKSELTLLDLIGAYPLSFVLPPEEALALEKLNIDKIIHLLLPHSEKLLKEKGITLSENIEQLLEKLLTFDFKTIIENEGVDITKLSLLSTPQRQQLRESGCITIQQFLVLSNNLLSKIKGLTLKTIEQVDSLLALPLYAFGSLIEEDPHACINAMKKGCQSIKNLYYLKVSDVENLYGVQKELLEKAIEGFSSKIAKKYLDNAVPKLNVFNEIRKKDLEGLEKYGIKDIRQLAVFSEKDLELIDDPEIQKRLAKVLQRINVSLSEIPVISEHADKLPVKTWGELLFLSEKQINSLTGLSYPAIRKIRTTVPSLAPKSKEKKKIEKSKGTAAEKPAKKKRDTPKKAPKEPAEKPVKKGTPVKSITKTKQKAKETPSSKTKTKTAATPKRKTDRSKQASSTKKQRRKKK